VATCDGSKLSLFSVSTHVSLNFKCEHENLFACTCNAGHLCRACATLAPCHIMPCAGLPGMDLKYSLKLGSCLFSALNLGGCYLSKDEWASCSDICPALLGAGDTTLPHLPAQRLATACSAVCRTHTGVSHSTLVTPHTHHSSHTLLTPHTHSSLFTHTAHTHSSLLCCRTRRHS
jgi:hypothetical protein